MKIQIRYYLIAALCYASVLFANTDDDTQPLSITSDEFHYDNQSGVATYTGSVVATQGSRKLTGDRLEIFRDASTDKLDYFIVYGKPAYYQGLTDADKPLLYAHAETITYKIPTNFLILEGSADVEQGGDQYTAARIEYDGIKETIYSPPSQSQQTLIILKGHNDANTASSTFK